MTNLAVAGLIAAAALPAHAGTTLTYVTDFTKTSNIYANLNQQYPNTGPGVPGSRVGTPNASFLYTPYTYSPTTDKAGNDGASFKLTSDAQGHDFAEFGSAGFGLPGAVSATTNVKGATTVYALLAAYNGVGINATFTGANGATETFSNIGIPDFNGGSVNSCSAVNGSATTNLCDQTAFIVTDVGAGGSGNSSNGAFNNYSLTEVTFTLDSALRGTSLTNIAFTTGGYEGLLLGLTVAGPSKIVPTPEPAALALLGLGATGLAVARRRSR